MLCNSHVVTYLVLGSCLFSKGQDSRHTDSQMESTDIVDLGLLNQGPDVRLLQVVKLVLVGRSKVGDQATVVASDDRTALSSRLGVVDTVFSVDTSLLAGVSEDVGVLVAANTADVKDGVLRKDVLAKCKH